MRIRATRFGRGTFVGKLIDYFSYYLGVAWKLGTMRPAPERIVALTTPPYLSVLARMMSKIRGGDHAHWVMDIYPDVMVAHGMLKEGGMVHRLLARLARWGWGGKRRVTVLTLGPCMAERLGRLLKLERKTASADLSFILQPSTFNLSHVPLWSMAEREVGDAEVRALRAARGWREDEVVVMYSGNMGLGHRFGELFEAIRELARSSIGLARLEASSNPSSAAALRAMADRPNPLPASGCMSAASMNPSPNPLTLSGFSAEPRIPGGERAICPEAAAVEACHPTSNPSPNPLPGGERAIEPGGERAMGPGGERGTRFRFVFFGRGRRRAEVEAFLKGHPDLPVELHDYVAEEELAAHLRSADVHVASLDPAWTGTMLPSKLQGIFAAGRPVVFVGGEDSSMAAWVRQSGAGWVVAPGNAQALVAALLAARDRDLLSRMGQKAAEFGMSYFEKESNVSAASAALIRRGTGETT
jgi:hypothetical protein